MSPFTYAKVNGESSSNHSLEQQETHPGPDRLSIWHKAVKIFFVLRWPAAFLLLLLILACELSIFHVQPASLQIGGDINKLVPTFSREQKIFRDDDRYSSDHRTMASINKTKQHWQDLFPRGGGFMNVPDHLSHTLPPPMHFTENPGEEIFAIAVFHEIHCLMHMAGFIDKLVMKIRNKDLTLNEGEIGHNDHCVNYLRNTIMCCGDTTLEGQSQSPMFKDVPGTTGTGAVHVCRNYDEISVWAEKERTNDYKEVL